MLHFLGFVALLFIFVRIASQVEAHLTQPKEPNMRTIELHAPIGHTIGDIRARVGPDNFDKALSYLATWAYMSTKSGETGHHVVINVCHDNEITALYQKSQGAPGGMLMVAVWRHATHEYTFHT